MDIENARRRLILPGYKHPEATNTTRSTVYKTFSEKHNDFGNTVKDKKYATMSHYIDASEKCPECNSNIVERCQCSFSDKKCVNGHIFYVNRQGEIKIGNPHH